MARGKITDPRSIANMRAGIAKRSAKIAIAEAAIEAALIDGPAAAGQVIQDFVQTRRPPQRPDSDIVRLYFAAPEEAAK